MPADSVGEILSAIVIGCGNIAGGYDESAKDGLVLSHAGAYRRHPRIHVAACVEPDEARRKSFMARWGVPRGFADLEACLTQGLDLDLASICTPTPCHDADLERLLATPVRAVFCEKPTTTDIECTRRILTDYERAEKRICVNYLRRWDPEMGRLRDELAVGKWGDIRSVTGFYAKGLRNNGSHMIDLLQFLLGPLAVRLVLRRNVDDADGDATTDALLTTSTNAPVYLIGGDSNDYTRFEVVIACQAGVIEIVDSGFRVRRRRVGPHRYFRDHAHVSEGTSIETGLGTAMALAVDNLYAAVTEGATLASDGRSALSAETLCQELALLPTIGEAA